MKLDELARRASTDARASVSHLDIPPIGEREPRRSWTPILATVAVTALVVGGLAVLARDRTNRDTPSSADSALPPTSDVPRLGLALDGWSVTFAEGLDEQSGAPAAPPFVYYGEPGTDDPFANGDLLIAAFADRAPALTLGAITDGETVDVRGTTATTSTVDDQGLPIGTTSITWSERDADGSTAEVVLVSRSFDLDRLVLIAEELTIDVGTEIVTPAADLGLAPVGTGDGLPFDALRAPGEGFVVTYRDADAGDIVVINTARGTLTPIANSVRWWADDVRPVDVDGRPGILATFPDSEAPTNLGPIVAWSPVDGIVATVAMVGTDDTIDLVELASSAFDIDDATWEAYLAAAEDARAGANEFDEIFGRNDGTVGDTDYSWVLGVDGPDLCFNMQYGDEGSGSCQLLDLIDVPNRGARTIDNAFGPKLGYVVIIADRAVERVVEPTGTYSVERIDAGGLTWFVAVGAADVQPSFEVIVDGVVVDELGAAVEGSVDGESALATNPTAVAMGIDGMDVSIFDDTD